MAFVHRKKAAPEPSPEDLMEARDRVDAGFRLAFPELAEKIGLESERDPEPSPATTVDHKTAAAVARNLLDAHTSTFKAATALPLEGHMDLHLALNSVVNELDRVSGELAKRWEL